MIDQTHGGETSLALEPYEIHGLSAPARRPAKPARRSRVRVLGGAALALVSVAGASWAAMSFMAEPGRPRRGAVVTGSVDYPDLKDGVPALAVPRGQVRVVGTPSSASPAQEVAAMTASPVDSSAMANLAGGGTLPRAAAPAPVQVRVTAPAAVPNPAPAVTASIASAPSTLRADTPKAAPTPAPAPVASAGPPVQAAPPVPAVTAPLPTPRPAAVTPARTAARTPDAARSAEQPRIVPPAGAPAASLPPQRASATRPPARTEPVPPAPAADEDDHINVFGLAVPTIGATGRRIKESVETLGDAVGRL